MDKTVTKLLQELRGGNQQAADSLVPQVYDSLRRLAGRLMQGERSDHTLQATAVVNECYMELVDMPIDWKDRSHFFAIAARQMRRVLVDYARAHRSQKRGGDQHKQTLDEAMAIEPQIDIDIIELDDCLTVLAEFDSRKAQVIELHYFGGLTYEEMAAALEISEATVDRELRMAKAWLYREMTDTAET